MEVHFTASTSVVTVNWHVERERIEQFSGQSDDQDVRVPRLGGDGDDGEPTHGEHEQQATE